jgi:hypothetical protein
MKKMKLTSIIIFIVIFFQNLKSQNFEKLSTDNFSLRYDEKILKEEEGISNSIFLFFKKTSNKFSEHIKIITEDVSKYKKMDLEYYAQLREYVLKNKYFNIKKEIEYNPYHCIIFNYEKQGDEHLMTYEKIYFINNKIIRISYHSISENYLQNLPIAISVFKTLKLKK